MSRFLILVANLVMKGIVHGLKKTLGPQGRNGEEENGFEPKAI